jgi:hypothetical protein
MNSKPVYSDSSDLSSFSSSSKKEKGKDKYNNPSPSKPNNFKDIDSESSSVFSARGKHKVTDPEYNIERENLINHKLVKSITRAVIKPGQKVVLFLRDLRGLIRRLTGADRVIIQLAANYQTNTKRVEEVGCCGFGGNVSETTNRTISGGGLMKVVHIIIYKDGRKYGLVDLCPDIPEALNDMNISYAYIRLDPKRAKY